MIHPYIERTSKSKGKAIISGTRTRIINIIAYYKLGYSAEELLREFPHLSLAQIHDVLSFYYENKTEIDAQIEDEQEENLFAKVI
jgi:uncharacterized protein (DUF433 family)